MVEQEVVKNSVKLGKLYFLEETTSCKEFVLRGCLYIPFSRCTHSFLGNTNKGMQCYTKLFNYVDVLNVDVTMQYLNAGKFQRTLA